MALLLYRKLTFQLYHTIYYQLKEVKIILFLYHNDLQKNKTVQLLQWFVDVF